VSIERACHRDDRTTTKGVEYPASVPRESSVAAVGGKMDADHHGWICRIIEWLSDDNRAEKWQTESYSCRKSRTETDGLGGLTPGGAVVESIAALAAAVHVPADRASHVVDGALARHSLDVVRGARGADVVRGAV